MVTTAEPRLEAGSDEDLMQRIQTGDVPAFEAHYDRYSAEAFGLTRVICGSSHGAEEAVQEGFLAVWRSRSSFDRTRGSTRAWVFTVIRYRSLDLIRRTQRDYRLRKPVDELENLSAPACVDEEAEHDDEARRIRSALLRLPVAQREVIVLAYFGGLTHAEIAARLALPPGTVKGRMRLGLQKVKVEIDTPAHQSVEPTQD